MRISFATANFYFLPFDETLEIIAEAGFQNIELDLFWEWKQWTMAQHLTRYTRFPGDPVRPSIRVEGDQHP